jgi:hypothetical protein
MCSSVATVATVDLETLAYARVAAPTPLSVRSATTVGQTRLFPLPARILQAVYRQWLKSGTLRSPAHA